MALKKYLFVVICLVIAAAAITAVSASDTNATDEIISVDDSADLDDVLEVSKSDENSIISANEIEKNNTLGVKNAAKSVNIKAPELTTTYKSDKSFKIKVFNDKKKPVKDVKLKVKVYTGKKHKTHLLSSDSKGMVRMDTSKLRAGTHKVIISSASKKYDIKSLTSSIKIKPKALKLLVAFHKSKYYSTITIKAKNRSTKEYVNGVKIKLKIYTGKKYKTVKLKTGRFKKDNGLAKYLTNLPKYGSHKVKIQIYGNYKGSAKGKLVINKNAKKYYLAKGYFSKGKAVSYVKYDKTWIKTRLI